MTMDPSSSTPLDSSSSSAELPSSTSNKNGKNREVNPGMIIGPDGKPCKVCSGFQAWTKQAKREVNKQDDGKRVSEVVAEGGDDRTGRTIVEERADCPADSSRLGRHTWTLLHTIGAYYPVERPSKTQQDSVRQLITSLATIYPCQPCASHLQDYLSRFPPQIDNRSKLERWLCEAHNDVNQRLGKELFDCSQVSKRWRDGWDDGHCD
ncbi:uncharacterized protein PGTG_16071 [Puccinia graminis f. sp. tritici CRL 75-36-700-3]|uniref:Sulfhydryl oxidase n=1 Tax=Puccinia graminis f. sp. tritici (strain CRL 75-36-700-3 / race SCCL) TaxID=418459 RepID=E3L1Q9_PUCGT|nr:uncharacterized protein PGTG_16071 [Puccinia graminis f. sp. tritici CRL 75-36-700-3]EFP90484.2 hypothetical protein PGTG_16071 [Puccinia graminis f. sp. tritici CRL 75-36-700-3]